MAEVGAPPDELNRYGQNWDLPLFSGVWAAVAVNPVEPSRIAVGGIGLPGQMDAGVLHVVAGERA